MTNRNSHFLSILQQCLSHLEAVGACGVVTPNSLPIPFFGDLSAYRNSPLRILTAALNPSQIEFPETGAPRFDVPSGRRGPEELQAELSGYFKLNPYKSWFLNFEKVLIGMSATYGGKMSIGQRMPNTALHIDMCSPIATSPTWSKLSSDEKIPLLKFGNNIFWQLLYALQPHVVLCSTSWGHLRNLGEEFCDIHSWQICYEEQCSSDGTKMRSPIRVWTKTISLDADLNILFCNASAANTPFGKFSDSRKEQAGKILLQQLANVN